MNNSYVVPGLNHVKIHGAGESLNTIISHLYLLQEAARLMVEAVSKTNTVNKLDQNIISSKRAQRMGLCQDFIRYFDTRMFRNV